MATFIIKTRITVEGFKSFNAVSRIEVHKSINNYLDTAKVTIPSRVKIVSKSGSESSTISKLFKRGLKIKIEAAYNDSWNVEFEGFISRLDSSIPAIIECEGYAFQLREKNINKIYRNVALKDVLKDLIEGTDIELHPDNDDIQIDKLEYIKFPRFEALTKLGQDFAGAVGFWFKGNQLCVGLKYTYFSEKNKDWKADVVYKAGYNYVREGTLRERNSGDANNEVELILKNQKGETNHIKAGLPNSNTQRKKLGILSFENIKDAERLAKSLSQSGNYAGMDGSITAFLSPFCAPGYKIKNIDLRFPDLSGNYLCEEVVTTISRSGARRKIKISYKL